MMRAQTSECCSGTRTVFPTACGHGSIALGVWALHTGRVAADPSGTTDVVIDVPSGRVTARVHGDGDRIASVDFVNVPSYLLHSKVPLRTARGDVKVDIAFGGAIYAHLSAADVGLSVTPEAYTDLIAVGREVKWALNDSSFARHPSDDRLSSMSGTILFDSMGPDDDGNLHQRNVTVFADGEVDRSPCGSGTSSRVAVLASDGRLRPGKTLIHDSVIGTRFHARILEEVDLETCSAIIPELSGMAFRTGQHTFTVDPADDLGTGFVLR